MTPLPSSICGSILTATNQEKDQYERIAFENIVDGKMAVLLLAGGQGTRLGVDYPKGMYKVGVLSGKSLFQLQAERLLKLQHLAEQRTGRACQKGISWYIMTSEGTINPTVEFFESHNYFGLNPANVVVFQVSML
jgi:UDP-N-acetylglucosamine/UDP-N-acetylgalactosamine diphosphorylase